MGKIRKAVITAAGSGSRLLPFSKGTPKEMLPFCVRSNDGRLILKPILEVVYESLYDHGCCEFCFVVGRSKRSIEDYFLVDDSARYSTNSDLQDFYLVKRYAPVILRTSSSHHRAVLEMRSCRQSSLQKKIVFCFMLATT